MRLFNVSVQCVCSMCVQQYFSYDDQCVCWSLSAVRSVFSTLFLSSFDFVCSMCVFVKGRKKPESVFLMCLFNASFQCVFNNISVTTISVFVGR